MPVKIASQFWMADWHLSFLLGLLLLVVFVIYPMGDRGPFVGVVLQAFFSLILISGVAMVSSRRTMLTLAALFAVGTAAIGWIRLYAQDERLTALATSMWIMFFAMLAGVILIRVLGEGRINFHRIQGAVAIYLLLGAIWAGCYRLVIYIDPQAFTLPTVAD